jgi:hypothetical protein
VPARALSEGLWHLEAWHVSTSWQCFVLKSPRGKFKAAIAAAFREVRKEIISKSA